VLLLILWFEKKWVKPARMRRTERFQSHHRLNPMPLPAQNARSGRRSSSAEGLCSAANLAGISGSDGKIGLSFAEGFSAGSSEMMARQIACDGIADLSEVPS